MAVRDNQAHSLDDRLSLLAQLELRTFGTPAFTFAWSFFADLKGQFFKIVFLT